MDKIFVKVLATIAILLFGALIIYFLIEAKAFDGSCESKSGNLIGSFRVIKKVSKKEQTLGLNQSTDCGKIYLVSSHNDTMIVDLVFSNKLYLNTKVGDVVLVSKDDSGTFNTNDRIKKLEIGYCKITKKINVNGTYKFEAVSRGGDTIQISRVPEIIYFNTSINDSVFVKKNRNLGIYYTE